MKLPPLKNDRGETLGVTDVTFHTLSADIHIVDEGGGAYLEISADDDDRLRLDPQELRVFTNWACAACAEVDRYNQHGVKP